nr:MAG TPA: hypothetical protein [Caudoviricetes sp.]
MHYTSNAVIEESLKKRLFSACKVWSLLLYI